ncbi:hypothetical protein GCM10023189_07160 [Nibrella saemangeumensis]|uniref:Ubiquinone biosynthesis protein UbiA n=1 Tax=Nibrella saemangeumensis TaxID=1084526 RepID=A0ABP8MGY2_9BACT
MTARAVWLHLRVPFSFFLLPVFWFALSQSPQSDTGRALAVVLIIHLLLYPASNAYNSYYDKDEGSIGILEAPPPVDRTLFYVAWGLDLIALVLGAFIGWPFVLYLLVYGAISKAYSNDRIRLKKYPVISWLVVGFFQGGFTYLMTYQAINDLPLWALTEPRPLLAGLLCTLNLLAIYPITQVYQHDEDSRRGDLTMSRLLGIRGTFVCAIAMFGLSVTGYYFYFEGGSPFYMLLGYLLPAAGFFLFWYWQVYHDTGKANFRSAMRMTLLAGLGLNAFFLTLLLLNRS